MTLNDLAQLALQQRGVYAAGESLSAEDFALVSEAMTRAFGELEAFDLAVWELNDTPDYLAEAFISYAAPSFMGAFGQAFDEGTAEAVRRQSRARLRTLLERGWRSPGPRPDYF